jgi:hypothetical protein
VLEIIAKLAAVLEVESAELGRVAVRTGAKAAADGGFRRFLQGQVPALVRAAHRPTAGQTSPSTKHWVSVSGAAKQVF